MDGSGNIYVAGDTLSGQLTVTNAFEPVYEGGYPDAIGDAFVAKFDSTGSNLVYLTYLGGNGDDAATGIAVDAEGNAYITGVTDSIDYPANSPLSSNRLPEPLTRQRTASHLLLDKAFVAAHHQLGFDLFHRVQNHADHDEQTQTGQLQYLDIAHLAGDERDNRNHRQEERSRPGNIADGVAEVLCGWLARTDAGDKAALLLQGARQVLLLVNHHRVKEGKTDDEQKDKNPVDHAQWQRRIRAKDIDDWLAKFSGAPLGAAK